MTCKPCLGMEGLIIINWFFPQLFVYGLLSQICKALQVGTHYCAKSMNDNSQICKALQVGTHYCAKSMNDNRGWILVLSGCLSPPMILCLVYFCSHLLLLH